tara:strand:- start:73 stop:2673 length:2601 start_codon:yes stop_codon:yes gene_type:complete
MKINNKKFQQGQLKLRKKILRRLIFLALFFLYSYFLLSFNFRKNFLVTFLSKNINIPSSTKQIIKDSIPYQLYLSGFKVNFVKNYISSLGNKVTPITLDIKFKQFEKLSNKRKQALKNGVLLSSDEDYVDANISHEDSKLSAKIRLKGDWIDHLQSQKWSFRVKLKNDNTLLGMNKFSLQSPGTRNYLSEWIFHKLLREEGLPSLRYKFKPLIINGKDMGIYAIEEHFDKILLESNSFREAPILKLSESLYWENQSKFKNTINKNIYKTSYSTGFKLNKIKNNAYLTKNFNYANNLLNGFHSGNLKTSQVFDLDLLAKYFAITELTSSHHSSTWHNLRFYFDPFQAKLIPIGFDGDTNRRKIDILNIEKDDHWRSKFFSDIEFSKKYYQELNRVSKKSYLDNFFRKNKTEFNNNKNILYKSFPAYELNVKDFYLNQKKIKEKLQPIQPLTVFKNNIGQNEINLSISNNQSFPIQIISLKSKNKSYLSALSESIIPGTKYNNFVKYHSLILKSNDDLSDSNDLTLIYKIVGSNEIYESKINNFPMMNFLDIYKTKSDILNDLSSNQFVIVDTINKKVIFKTGQWKITEPIIIPPGYEVVAKPNLKINLINSGRIISYSPLKFIGGKDEPIIIKNLEGNKANGIAVINSKEFSHLKNVHFFNMDSIQNEKIILTGGVSFYQSDVKIIDCSFLNSLAEDSLNIVRSTFEIKNSLFYQSASDSIDIDFSAGLLDNVSINKSNNDGLDLSGSKVFVKGLVINNSSDKALSLGEGSDLNVEDILINKAFIGVANKDSSILTMRNAIIKDTEIDFAGFQKKLEFQGSQSKINGLNKSIDKFKYLLSEGSRLILNNKELKINEKNENIVRSLYK